CSLAADFRDRSRGHVILMFSCPETEHLPQHTEPFEASGDSYQWSSHRLRSRCFWSEENHLSRTVFASHSHKYGQLGWVRAPPVRAAFVASIPPRLLHRCCGALQPSSAFSTVPLSPAHGYCHSPRRDFH